MGKLFKTSIIENVPFWVLAGVSIVMGIIAFFTPPRYDIPKSVLSFISWMFAFAALWTVFVAMMKGIDARISHGKTSLTVGSLEGDKNPTGTPPEDDTETE